MNGIEVVAHYLAAVAGIAIALLGIAAFVWTAGRLGWRAPVDIADAVTRILSLGREHDQFRESLVNVELQDASGAVMDFGSFVEVTMQNGRGVCYKLREGKFEACNPTWIKAGAQVDISYQQGRVKECLPVQVDYKRQRLFVHSKRHLDEVLALINSQ
jgi:hypothetical protein